MSLYLKLLLKYIEIHRKSKRLRRIVFGLACMVVFVTVYQLIIPTITLTKKNADNMAGISTDDGKMTVLDCGLKVHQHDKSCYRMIKGKKTLVCGQADYVIHEHDDSCYAVDDKGKKVLVCELPEIEEHKHNDTCYDNEIILVCGKEQSEGHTHTDECYKTETELICDQEEHLHDDSCYSEAENENGEISRVLTCKLKEHKHDKDCYQTSKVLICEKQEEEGHTHSDTCYETKKVLTCSESEPHKHTQKCYEKGHTGDAEYLICGKPELKAHQHTRKCFTRVQADHADDSDDPDSAEGETESENTETDTEIISDEVHQSDTEETEAVTGTPEEIDTEEGKDTGNDGNQRDSEFETEDESESNDTVEVSDTESEEEPSSETETPSTAAKDSGSTVEEIVFSRMLTNNTGIWRKTGEGDWIRIGKSTKLNRKENLMVRIAYSIPKGTLTNENAYVIYELPENLGVTWDIADRVNIKENRLNQIIEGTRLPDEKKEGSENLAGYYEMAGISDDKDESRFLLELQFNDYTISENASHDVEGWLVFYLKDAALEHGKDGTGRIVFSKKAVNGKKVTVSYIVEDEVSAGSEDDTRTSDETAATEKETETEETAENEETAEKESMQGDEQNPADPAKGITYPALDFQESTKKLTVSVQAEEGAFPLGTTLNVEDIEDKDTLDSIREAASEEADSANIKYIQAVDITFTDKNDREIEPLKPVRVSITCPETKGAEDAMVMHVDDEGDVQVVDQVDQAELTDTPADNEFIFDTDSFPVFAIVGTTMEKTVLASDGHNYKVSVTCGADAGIPEGAELIVSEILPEDPQDAERSGGSDDESASVKTYSKYVSNMENALGFKKGSAVYIRLFDIKIVNKYGEKIQPAEGTTVDVKIELADAHSAGLSVVHFADGAENGDVVETTTYDSEDGQTISFAANGFSIYAITDDPGDNARIGYRFWYNDGTQNVLLSTQYFRYKDVHPTGENATALTINEPGIPGIESTTWNRIFRGWSKTTFNDEDSNLVTVENLNTELTGLAESDYTEGTFTDLYANLKDVYYVTYVDVNPNNVLATEIVPKAESGATVFDVKPESQLRPTIDSDTVLEGWYDINDPDTVYTPGQENVVVDKNVTLYPKIEGGSWLIFDDNDLVDDGNGNLVSGGASFTPPAFYLDEVTQKPVDPVWAGYEFGGWYTDRECTTPFTFGGNLSHDTTVYAKWIPSASQCRVIIWKQRTSDSPDASDAEKTYDYVTSYLDESVVTGETVTLDASYKNIYGSNGTSTDNDKGYFLYNADRTDQSVVVKADGSSVLNVYYDRKPVTLNFYTWDYGYTPATNNNGTQYGLVDGQYVQLTRSGNNPNYRWTYVIGTDYSYNLYTGTNNGDYYIPDGNGGYTQVHLYRNNNRWYRNRTWSLFGGYSYTDEYTGNVYTRSEENITATYTGTRYTRNNSRSWILYKSFVGLYNSTLEENGYTWPAEYDWYENGNNNGNVSGTRTTFMSAFLPTEVDTSGSSVTDNFYGRDPSGSYHIHFLVQNLDGTYTEKDTVDASGRSFYISDKYIGYHAVQYRADNGNWNGVGTKDSDGYYNNGNTVSFTNNLYIRFNLNDRVLTFYTNNGSNQVIDYTVPYSKSLSEYAGQNEGQKNGYYFLGWFADPGCTEPFDFSQTMPDNNIAVYGKWRLERFRIVIEPGASNVYMGSQATRFRLNYDERIDGGLLESATRAGYILDGWYTDPDFTNRFLFSSPVNASTPGVDMTYHDSPSWAAARAAYGDDTEAYDNVRGILHLYAKWIPDTDSTGINVVYDAGDAAIYDSLGALLTTVPVDTHMYAFDGTPTAREAPSNYNDLYTFKYWEATTEDGETVHFYPGDPVTLADLAFTDPVYDDSTGELLRKTVTLRAVYDQTGDPSRMTHITFDGNTFTDNLYTGSEKVMQGEARDGTHRHSVTSDEEINQTITLPSEDDFYLEGWKLAGWSFTEGTYAEQVSAATEDAPNFLPGQRVAADNLFVSTLNDEGNTLYAMWQPKEYTVTVRQVIEDGVPVNSFTYVYKRGVENNIENETSNERTLTGSNSSFTEENFEYYDREGHVIRITTPTPTDDTYDVRVNAIVTKDDGTTEILNPTAAGDYRIVGDVVITYTYSLKVPVKLQKRDAIAHSTVLTEAEFVVTPVEYNTSTQRWENAGTGTTITINAETIEQYLQEGTYRITETNAPENYAKVNDELYLTVKKDEPFTLFTASGGTVNSSIAELDTSGRILTVYDNPIRTVTLKKLIEGGGEETFAFKVTVFNNDGTTRLAGYTIGEKGGNTYTTSNIGEARVSLGDQESIPLSIPHGSKITVEEIQNQLFTASYTWNNSEAVDGNVFGSEPVEITANGELTFTNRHATKKLRIKKIGDDAPDGLAGAEFSLTAKQGTTINNFTGMTGLVSMAGTPDAAKLGFLPGNESADTTLFVLPIGTYTLTETEEPEYYAGLTGTVEVNVNAGGITVTASEGDETLINLSEPDSQGIYTLTVKNTRKKATVKVVKDVIGLTTDQNIGFHFTVTGLTEPADSISLYGTYKAAETAEPEQDGGEPGQDGSQPEQGSSDSGQEGSQPGQENTGQEQQGTEPEHLHEIEYSDIPFGTTFSVTEDNTYAAFDTVITILNADGTRTVIDDALTTGELTVRGDVTITYTNTRKSIPIKVVKTDQLNNPLAGAAFEGDLITGGSVTTQITGTEGNEEAIIIENDKVPLGSYTITETQAPAGYISLAGPVKIDVKAEEQSGDILVEVSVNDEPSAFASAERIDTDHPEFGWIVTVRNDAGATLPHTGGSGTGRIYLIGFMMIVFAAIGILMRKKKSSRLV